MEKSAQLPREKAHGQKVSREQICSVSVVFVIYYLTVHIARRTAHFSAVKSHYGPPPINVLVFNELFSERRTIDSPWIENSYFGCIQ